MADPRDTGVQAMPKVFVRIGTLRYFNAAGAFAADLAAIMGGPLPQPLQAVHHFAAGGATGTDGARSGIMLVFRSSTETLALCSSTETFDAIERFAADRTDLCLIEQTGGIWCCGLTGARAPEVLARLGSIHAVPQPGQALTGRLAEVTVTSVGVQAEEFLLITDRVYADHLSAWMRATLEDL